jgi:hypothetical protein
MRYVRSSKFLWWMLMDRLGRYKDPFRRRRAPVPMKRRRSLTARRRNEHEMKPLAMLLADVPLPRRRERSARGPRTVLVRRERDDQHESNVILHADENRQADWLSTTEFGRRSTRPSGATKLVGNARSTSIATS